MPDSRRVLDPIVGQLLQSSHRRRNYLVLDAARDQRIYPALCDLSRSAISVLLTVPVSAPVAQVAPYLVDVEQARHVVDLFSENGWAHAWGYFISSQKSLDRVASHFRAAIAQRHDKRRSSSLFRCFDPRVIRWFSENAKPLELRQFFEPLDALVLPGPNGTAQQYSWRNDALNIESPNREYWQLGRVDITSNVDIAG